MRRHRLSDSCWSNDTEYQRYDNSGKGIDRKKHAVSFCAVEVSLDTNSTSFDSDSIVMKTNRIQEKDIKEIRHTEYNVLCLDGKIVGNDYT